MKELIAGLGIIILGVLFILGLIKMKKDVENGNEI